MSLLIAERTDTANPPARPYARELLQAAVREGQERYFARCQQRIPTFITRHMTLRGAARRYYPPQPLEIVRLTISVTLTPFMAAAQLVLWAIGRGQNSTWLAIKSRVQRFTLPRAHALLAAAVQTEVFGAAAGEHHGVAHELEHCLIGSPSFATYLRIIVAEKYPQMPQAEVQSIAHDLVISLQDGSPVVDSELVDHYADVKELADHARQQISTADIHRDLESVAAGEAARSDVVNTILTGFMAKITLGQLKLGAYGLAMMIAPPLYFRWSNGREERIRRAIDGLLPDGRWSLSRAGWNFDWTESFESVALMACLFLGISAVLSVIGYLIAPLMAPLWRLTGLPTISLRRAVEASRQKVLGGSATHAFSPEVFASKIGDLAELFSRSG